MLGERVKPSAIKEVVRSGVERKLTEGDIYRAAKRTARQKELVIKAKRDAKSNVTTAKGPGIIGGIGRGSQNVVNNMLGVPVKKVPVKPVQRKKKIQKKTQKMVTIRVPASQFK